MKEYKLIGLIVFMFFFNTLNLLAQDPPVFIDNVTDVPTSPINNWISILLLAVIGFGYVFSKRKQIIK